MGLLNLLWVGIWSGMFADPHQLGSPNLYASFFSFIQGVRSIVPLIAGFICLVLLLGTKSKFALQKNTISYLFFYCMVGTVSSFFMSPNPVIAFYWAGLYLSPLLTVWMAQKGVAPLKMLRSIIKINYVIVFLIFISFIPQTIDLARGRAPFTQMFDLPFNMGQVRVNGVGRYALIVCIVAFVRLSFARKKIRIFWIFFIGMALLNIAYMRSRTTLLGLGVASLLYVYIQKLDWRFFLAGPVAAYVLWISGYKWRAQQNVENLLNLSGREYTWQRGLEQVGRSPLFGWGFHADRLLLRSEHMHNSYLHAAIHGGILGALFFVAGILSIWRLMIKRRFLKNLRYLKSDDKPFLFESVLLVGYLTSRSIFESTAAFYGVDLLIYLPAAAYIILWLYEHPDSGQVEKKALVTHEG